MGEDLVKQDLHLICFRIVELSKLKKKISEDDIFELATSAGAKDCSELKNYL